MVKVRPGIAPKTSPKMEPNRSAPTTLGANEIASVERHKSISEPPSEHAGGKVDAEKPAHQQPEADGEAERHAADEQDRPLAQDEPQDDGDHHDRRNDKAENRQKNEIGDQEAERDR